MKTILIAIAAFGLAISQGYAQEKKCTCKKVTHHTHKKTTAKTVAVKKTTRSTTRLTYTSVKHTTPTPTLNGLSSLAMAGTGSSCRIDSNGEIQYINDGAYMGNYPTNKTPDCDLGAALVPRYTDLVVTSTAFANYGVMPAKYTCMGQQVNPPLKVGNIPPGTASLAVIMFDPNATAKKSTTYWLIWNIDTTGGLIPENFATDHQATSPINGRYGYLGACPAPSSGTHYYHFRVYALDTKLLMNNRATKVQMEQVMRGHVLAKGEIIGQAQHNLD